MLLIIFVVRWKDLNSIDRIPDSILDIELQKHLLEYSKLMVVERDQQFWQHLSVCPFMQLLWYFNYLQCGTTEVNTGTLNNLCFQQELGVLDDLKKLYLQSMNTNVSPETKPQL